MTAKERDAFAALSADGKPAPTTVGDHNARLQEAARAWAEGDSPEERLAALLAQDMLLAPDPVDESDEQVQPGADTSAKQDHR
ncbi:hypothetical protein [Roseateles sp. BYS96W]|uniref:hypothetical protein n=1 Tax=Pelomonas nitida TaxID=3299027 RepID=UPI0037495759